MGHTVALLGTVGRLGTFRAPYKNIWGFGDAVSAFLTTRPHFLFLEDMYGGIFTSRAWPQFLSSPPIPGGLLVAGHKPDGVHI